MELKQLTAKDLYPDSLEVGTPAKGGTFKVYCDFSNLEEAKKKIDNAAEALSYANTIKDIAKVPNEINKQ